MIEVVLGVSIGWTILSLWLLADKRRSGFMFGLASQGLWLVFDWQVGAYGLMPLALILGFIYVRGWRKWSSA